MLHCLNRCSFTEGKLTYVALTFQNKIFENYDCMSYGFTAILYKPYSNTWFTEEMLNWTDSSYPTHLYIHLFLGKFLFSCLMFRK